MKARVITFLNLRTGTPEVLLHNNPGDSFFSPGDVVDIAETVIGEMHKDSNIWYKLRDGGFVWSGGIETDLQVSGNFQWWLQNPLFSIPRLWQESTKKSVKVAVLDTGISPHVNFDFSRITGFDYLSNSKNFKVDNQGHGTHCSGIIAGRGSNFFGIAPETQLFIAKVCDDSGTPNLTATKNALADILAGENGADNISIINMSLNLIATSEEELQVIMEIENLLARLSGEKKCLLVAASGRDDDTMDAFPAALPECISVGCLNSEWKRDATSRKTMTLDIMAPGTNILSLNGVEAFATDTGTSQATAFVSGVCALVLQKVGTRTIDSEIIKKSLYASAFSNGFAIQEYGHGIINSNLFFETLKTV